MRMIGHYLAEFLIDLLGYERFVQLGDFILFWCAFVLGVLFMSLLTGNFIRKLYQVEDFGQKAIKMVRITTDGKSKYYVHFSTFFESVQQVLLLAFSQFFRIKDYTYRDERRTKIFLITMSIVFAILIFSSLALISSVTLPSPLEP